MVITAINPYKKGDRRWAVYLNDEFAFVLYKGELSKYKLSAGLDMTEELYDRILQETLYKRARLRGMNLLQKMDRTEADIRNKLAEGGYPEIVIDDAILYLKSYKYIDDLRYANDYVAFKKEYLSYREIMQKLKEKGVPDNLIEEALSDFDRDNELELLKKLMIKKAPNPDKLEYKERMKLFSYLYRKGFSTESIERVFHEF